MAVSAVVALASSVSYTAAAGFAFSLGAFATSFALGVALNALTPKPSVGQGANRGYQVNSRGSALDHQIIYGKVRVGGAIVYDEATGTNNKFLHRIIAVSGHEIESFDEIYINDEVVTLDGSGNVTSPSQYNGKVRINTHLGSPDQAADADLVAESAKWTAQHRLRGIAYMYVRLQFDADAFPNGVPTFTATVKGKKVYNPDTDTTAWSDNPALCLRDYLTSSHGLAELPANIDDDLVNAAVTVCNQTNTDAGTTRYTTNGAFTTDLTPYDVINNLLTSISGTLWYAQGKWRMKPGYWTTPVLDLNEDDLRSSISVATRHSRRDNFNVVKGTFRGEESNWQTTDYPQVDNAAFLAADNGQESVADVDLPFTDNSVEARRIARIALESNRQQLTVTASFGIKTMQVQVGDNVRLTNSRFGWDNKEFQVLAWNFGLTDGLDLQVELTLRETAESVFDEVDDGVVYERDNTNLLSPFEVPAVSIAQNSIVTRTRVIRESVTELISFSVSSASPELLDRVEVEYKEENDTQWSPLGVGQLGLFELVDPEVGSYQFRARGINTFGIRGEWAYSAVIDTANSRFPPRDVKGFSYEVNGSLVNLDWEATPNFDLSYYKIRHAVETADATWSNATTAVEKIPRPATSLTLPSREGTYLIRAFDKTGIGSESATSLVVSGDEVPSFTNSLTQSEQSTFSGIKLNCEVESSELVISPDLAYEASSADGINYEKLPINSSFIPEYDISCFDLFVKPDGKKVYYVASDAGYIVQFDLQVPFNLNTIVFSSEKVFVLPTRVGQPHNVQGLYIKDDGRTVFWTSTTDTFARVYVYEMQTPWDITTAIDTGDSFSVGLSNFSFITGIKFKSDGSEMYLCGNNWEPLSSTGGSFVRQYSMSTNWDVTTASLTNSLDLSPEITESYANALAVSPDGTRLFVNSVQGGVNKIYGYTLSTAWDISTASYSSGDFSEFIALVSPNGSEFLTGMNFDDTGGNLLMSFNSIFTRGFVQTTIGQSATYTFSDYIETHDSTSRKVRARIDAGVDRLSRTTGFDELVGLFDFLDGLFDDLNVSTQSGDTNLLFYISTTEDDPSGTPTWSEYKKFRCGEFYGRAFRFQVRLISAGTTITPSIETLTAFVEYD